MSFTRESQIITLICLVDLAVTLVLLSSSRADEGNPLMNFYLQFGTAAFILAKLCLLFLPIFIAEWCRQYRPQFVQRAMRLAIAAYLGVYAVLFLQHNVPVLLEDSGYKMEAPQSSGVQTAYVLKTKPK